ncbi:hypothetical protein [Rose yellow vein virus]|uniref:Uncharacterized protein n=1 Tax=Rose yellow vein virus TaxID=1213588 RepID=I7CKJ1_9VIRU|nr:hypothetical protein [Rose yellow vein virus]AFO54494.1 hypothetical protein [Rose yellow vein virus]
MSIRRQEVTKAIQLATSNLTDKVLYLDQIGITEPSFNEQVNFLGNLSKTNQYVSGVILLKLEQLEEQIRAQTIDIQNLDKKLSKEKGIESSDLDPLLEQIKELNISKDVQQLSRDLESLKGETSIQPQFGWMTEGKADLFSYRKVKPGDSSSLPLSLKDKEESSSQ